LTGESSQRPPWGKAKSFGARLCRDINQRQAGLALLVTASSVLVGISVPVLWRGAPLADDFNNCLEPQRDGLGSFMAASYERLGLIRPARFVEIIITSNVCRTLPFGFAIAVGLVFTFVTALLLRHLLKALGSSPPWPDVAAAVWLLQPLGTEAALWPAALHVPMGLAAALGSLINLRAGRRWLGRGLGLIAMLSVEQTILALPLATWLVVRAPRRRTESLAMVAVSGVVLASYILVPGNDPRLAVGFDERIHGLLHEPLFYVKYPIVAAGGQSIPMAVAWLLPGSLILLSVGAIMAGYWAARGERVTPRASCMNSRTFLTTSILVLLVNAPVLLSSPRQGSPRTFTPTWLLLCCVGALWAGQARWRFPKLTAGLFGIYLCGATLSLVLSVWVRVQTADIVEQAAVAVAARTTDGDVVTLCDVPRSAVSPAPRGAFSVQDYVYDWAAADALRYYTGRRVLFHIQQAGRNGPCAPDDSDLVLEFEGLTSP
jgi:hypothetical protein